MIGLLIAVILGLGVAYFSLQNTQLVTITLANYSLTGIALYSIVIAALLIGFFVAWIVGVFSSFSSSLIIHGKDHQLRNTTATIENLKAKIRDLEQEHTDLRQNKHIIQEKEDVSQQHTSSSFLQNIKEGLGFG